jgi:hypothetical protein
MTLPLSLRYNIEKLSCTEQDSNLLSQCCNISYSTCTGMWFSNRELDVVLMQNRLNPPIVSWKLLEYISCVQIHY